MSDWLFQVLHQQLTAKFQDNFPPRKFAVCMFSISVVSSSVDVNLEPNKTKVLIKDEVCGNYAYFNIL